MHNEGIAFGDVMPVRAHRSCGAKLLCLEEH